MNWLIIAPSIQDANCKVVEDFLQAKYDITPFEVFLYRGIPRPELYDDVKHIMQATHCIILDAARMAGLPDYVYVLGVLAGKQVRTFVYEGGSSEERYEALDGDKRSLFRCFRDLQDLLATVDENFLLYKSADNQRQALIQLFTLGIPFTSDCFAQHLAKDDSEICQLFFDAGMLMNARTSDGVPLLCVATRSECEDKVRWLLENGADIDAVSADRGYSAVMDAVWRKNYGLTKFLIERGASLGFISSDGQPILVLAVGNGNLRIVELLLENGADADVKDSMGMSAREYANLFKKPGMVEIMARFPPKASA